ncbi:hypothetical protein NP493_240g01065 [Ridgeia piscesae]|uniref:Uncharacterized protein n=1 Tax=Ridgeia piscesae TaxID=27915 RepID=A0AAD9NZG6_RIDPI|nr:hypothetical protein NP493_240g01065 [Ridgeia piscesae]
MRYLTSSRCPSCDASIRGVLQPSSRSASALMRKSATSRKPPQHARVSADSCVSSVWALMSAPCARRRATISSCPSRAASISGV